MNKRRHCGHCYSTAPHVTCAKCNRDMCEDCISIASFGKACGLCKDREDAKAGYDEYVAQCEGAPLDFDDWYDQHG